MKTLSSTGADARESLEAKALAIPHAEGFVAGLIGAATIAVWFFIIDLVKGRPLYTPSILGRVVFRGITDPGTGLPDAPFELIVAFTWLHALVFCAVGWIAVWLIRKAEASPDYGYGIALLMVITMSGFIVIFMFFAEPVLHALTIPAVLVGNLLALAAMGTFFRFRHPNLKMLP